MPKDYMTTAQIAEKFGIAPSYVRKLCADGAIKGAQLLRRTWTVPASFKWKSQKRGPKPNSRTK